MSDNGGAPNKVHRQKLQLELRGSPIKTYGAGRKCKTRGCITTLSIYRDGDICGACSEKLMCGGRI